MLFCTPMHHHEKNQLITQIKSITFKLSEAKAIPSLYHPQGVYTYHFKLNQLIIFSNEQSFRDNNICLVKNSSEGADPLSPKIQSQPTQCPHKTPHINPYILLEPSNHNGVRHGIL